MCRAQWLSIYIDENKNIYNKYSFFILHQLNIRYFRQGGYHQTFLFGRDNIFLL